MNAQQTKMFEQLRAIAEGRPPAPLCVEVHPTDACNHACIWCVALPERRKGAEMPGHRLLALIDELADAGTREISFSGGGDPLTHPNIGQAITLANQRGIAVEIITNGGCITDELMEIMLEHAHGIRFSLDAGTADMHRLIHRPVGDPNDTFEQIHQRIRSLVMRRRDGRPRIGTTFVLHSRSIETVAEFLEISQSIGVDFADIKQNHFARITEAQELAAVADRAVTAFHQTHPDFSVSYDRWIARRGEPATEHADGDHWPYLHMSATIDASGEVYPCCHLQGHQEFREGNVMQQSMHEMWFGDDRQRTLAAIAAGAEGCRVCINKSPNRTLIRALDAIRKRRKGAE